MRGRDPDGGKAELARGLIGVIDNLERALQAAAIDPDAEEMPEEPLAQGILLTYRELQAVLQRAGVESYDPAGEKFDPVWHEALQTRPAEDAEAGTVVEVLQKGFRLDGQVLRRGPRGGQRVGGRGRGPLQSLGRLQEGLRRGDQEGLPQRSPANTTPTATPMTRNRGALQGGPGGLRHALRSAEAQGV